MSFSAVLTDPQSGYGGLSLAICVSAWNKDPVFGVIGIQSGPRG